MKDYIISALLKVYSLTNEKKKHGLGLLIKCITISKFHVDFLSKIGYKDNFGKIIVHRKFDRTILSGNVSVKIDGVFSKEAHAHAITDSLKSWCLNIPLFASYYKYRV